MKPGRDIAEETCPKCQGTGYCIDRKTNSASPCDCGILDRVGLERRFHGARIPPRFGAKDFENFHPDPGAAQGVRSDPATVRTRREILQVAISYARGFNETEKDGFVLRGGTGTGKTHIAVAILKAIINRGYTGVYFNFTDLLSRIRDTYSEGAAESEGALLDVVDARQLLVLDDVGAERATDFVRDRLYLIINRRYENGRPIIMTTNLDDDELRARVGERTASRLCEMCSSPFPGFPAQDFRRAMMH